MRGRNGPERNFEVVAGKVLADETATRFAFVQEGTGSASPRLQQAMIQAGCTGGAQVTVLSDGDAGLRAIQREIAPKSEHILDWFHLAMRFQHVIQVARLSTALRDLLQYLNANRDSLPNYGKRYRADQPVSTAWVESTVNEIIAKRMAKKQQMRWNRFIVQPFLTVRVHVLNGTLEQVIRTWYVDFRTATAP